MNINGKITISRVHSNHGDDCIEVRLQDDAASCDFAIAKLSLPQFALAVTGLGYVDCEIEARHLDRVGKTMEHTTIEFHIPKAGWSDRKQVAAQVAVEHIPEGWVLSDSFGSQGSFFSRDGKEFARATIRRWV